MASALFFLFLFVALVRPEFQVSPAPRIFGDSFVWIAVLAALVFLSRFVRRRGELKTDVWMLFIAAAAVFLYFLLAFLFVGSKDPEMVRRTASLPISAVVGFSLAYFWSKRSGTDLDLALLGKWILSVAALQSTIIIAQMFIPSVAESLREIVSEPITKDGPSYLYRSGLRSVGGDALSLNQAALILVGLSLSLRCKSWKDPLLTVILVTVAAPATFVSGRTGAYLIGIIVAVGLVFWIFTAVVRLGVKREVFRVNCFGWLFVIGVIASITAITLTVFPISISTLPGAGRLMRPGDTLMTLVESHLNWAHIPDAVIWGTGQYGRSSGFYLSSDIGWIRTLHGAGVIGSLVLLLAVAIGWMILILRAGPLRLKISVYLCVLMMVFGHLKLMYIPTIIINNLFFFLVMLLIFGYGRHARF